MVIWCFSIFYFILHIMLLFHLFPHCWLFRAFMSICTHLLIRGVYDFTKILLLQWPVDFIFLAVVIHQILVIKDFVCL